MNEVCSIMNNYKLLNKIIPSAHKMTEEKELKIELARKYRAKRIARIREYQLNKRKRQCKQIK